MFKRIYEFFFGKKKVKKIEEQPSILVSRRASNNVWRYNEPDRTKTEPPKKTDDSVAEAIVYASIASTLFDNTPSTPSESYSSPDTSSSGFDGGFGGGDFSSGGAGGDF